MPKSPKGRTVKIERVVFNPTEKVITDPDVPVGSPYSERKGKYAHLCYDWDEMLIDEHDSEFSSCSCGLPNTRT